MNQELRSLWKLRLVALGLGILTLLIVFAIALVVVLLFPDGFFGLLTRTREHV